MFIPHYLVVIIGFDPSPYELVIGDTHKYSSDFSWGKWWVSNLLEWGVPYFQRTPLMHYGNHTDLTIKSPQIPIFWYLIPLSVSHVWWFFPHTSPLKSPHQSPLKHQSPLNYKISHSPVTIESPITNHHWITIESPLNMKAIEL